MATQRRKNKQRGTEILEFALVSLLYVPLLMGTFVTGMNLIRSIQANQVCRDLTNIYIHGGDFTTYPMQQLAQRLASGLNLQVGSNFTGTRYNNVDHGGDGLVTASQIMWIGSTADANCQAVGAANCTNHDKFVFIQRIQFGNGTYNAVSPSTLGTPTAGMVQTANGVVQNYITDSRAALPGAAQTNLTTLWQSNTSGTTDLADGQVVYVVETYFNSASLNLGSYPGQGVYARYFF